MFVILKSNTSSHRKDNKHRMNKQRKRERRRRIREKIERRKEKKSEGRERERKKKSTEKWLKNLPGEEKIRRIEMESHVFLVVSVHA
jgi:isopropylmalate/homocitrate/citramalate synthase